MNFASVAVLFARSDSVYKGFDLADVWDIQRDARNYRGDFPVVAHPPCRAWGRLRHFANPRPDEKDLAFFAIQTVRQFGGVLEHPAFSSLWSAANLPRPGKGHDAFGGWSLDVPQYWFGHRAYKRTWLYICGCEPKNIPPIPLVLGDSPCVLETSKKGDVRPSISRPEREATPPAFAGWLLDLAQRCGA